MEDNEQIVVRKQKLAALKASGAQAYPNDFFPSHTTADIQARFSSVSEEELAKGTETVVIAGRIMSLRHFGKAAFFHLQDRGGQVQVYIRQGDSPDVSAVVVSGIVSRYHLLEKCFSFYIVFCFFRIGTLGK